MDNLLKDHRCPTHRVLCDEWDSTLTLRRTIRFLSLALCSKEGQHEQDPEQQVDGAESKVGKVQAALQIENGKRRPVAEFFDYAGDHEGAEAHWVGGDDQERNLLGEPDSDEAVVEGGMRDRRRILPANQIEHEI
jgi:hypothetical protein